MYSVIVVAFVLIGSTLKVDLVWELADFFNGVMAIPNLIALLALSGVVLPRPAERPGLIFLFRKNKAALPTGRCSFFID